MDVIWHHEGNLQIEFRCVVMHEEARAISRADPGSVQRR